MKRLTEYTIPETGFSVVSEEKYKRILMEEKPSVEKVYNRLKKIEDILGDEYDLDRLREMVQAKREGRCVVLPAKIGDSIYFTFLGKIIEKQVFSVVTFYNSQRIYCNGTSLYFRPDDIGETVFLTRKAAEAALKGES